MKSLLLTTLILLTINGLVYSQNSIGEAEAKDFREWRDKEFCNPQTSPLLPKDFVKFEKLNYFAFDETYRIKANFVKTSEVKSFLMPTSTGTSRKYLKIGVLNFKLNDKEFSLIAFTREYPPDHPKAKEEINDLFVPFRDLSNGEETYSAGRYVYLKFPQAGAEVIIDFNLAYNPACAYGDESFVCSIPPKENFLQVAIRAGEKKFVSPSEKTTQ